MANDVINLTSEPYKCYIDNGTNWELYKCYIDNGTNWELYEILIETAT